MMPTSRGFDHYYGLLYSNDMIRPWVQTDVPLYIHRDLDPIEKPLNQDTLTVTYTKEAVRFIREAQADPFFLYLAYGMPHVPIHPAPHRDGLSRAGRYGDVIETIDWSVGEILKTLEEEGLDEDTIVIFTSDNGPWQEMPDRMFSTEMMPHHEPVEPWHAGSAGHLNGHKATTWEGGFRVPFIARWPGVIAPGRASAELVTSLELFPTLLNAAGVDVPSGLELDGYDVLPLLDGTKAASPRTTFFYYMGDRIEGVREGPWKLRIPFEEGERGAAQLFHLDRDPEEIYNLAEAHPEFVAQLRAAMDEFDASARP
jgi:arylsulfatase A-like enzyme